MDTPDQRFRHLEENSSDLIFILNEAGIITRMNAASKRALGFRPEEMVNEKIFEFISDGPDGALEAYRETARTNLSLALGSDKPVRFRTLLRMKQIVAGMEMDLNLQRTVVGSQTEVLVKSTTVYPEASELFLMRERGSYLISSNIAEGEIITRGLIARLGKYFDATELKKIQVGISEILLNAIEHGNLGISFDEKTSAIMEGDYMAFLLQRQKQPEYAGKKVKVDFVIDAHQVLIRITDAGKGFDHASYLKKVESDDSMLELEHGRGILIAKNVFDRAEYNALGNQILLVKSRKGL